LDCISLVWPTICVTGSIELLEQDTEDLVLLGDLAAESLTLTLLRVLGQLLLAAEKARLLLRVPAFEEIDYVDEDPR
jgi:hypothetical protein